ncbi:hypothetical protein HWV62_22762, partial [Athelia sp. TMB]
HKQKGIETPEHYNISHQVTPMISKAQTSYSEIIDLTNDIDEENRDWVDLTNDSDEDNWMDCDEDPFLAERSMHSAAFWAGQTASYQHATTGLAIPGLSSPSTRAPTPSQSDARNANGPSLSSHLPSILNPSSKKIRGKIPMGALPSQALIAPTGSEHMRSNSLLASESSLALSAASLSEETNNAKKRKFIPDKGFMQDVEIIQIFD